MCVHMCMYVGVQRGVCCACVCMCEYVNSGIPLACHLGYGLQGVGNGGDSGMITESCIDAISLAI